MSALRNPPNGYVYLVFEICRDEGLRYLACIPRSSTRRKVVVYAKVLPLRKTRGSHKLLFYCVHCDQLAAQIRNYIEAIICVFNEITGRVSMASRPFVGDLIDEESKKELIMALVDIPPALYKITLDFKHE